MSNAPTPAVRVSIDSRGDTVVGTLRRPEGVPDDARVPLVILGHGLGAIAAMGLEAYAARFREAGMATLTFDYRGFGESGGRPRQWLSVRRQLEDWRAVIQHARHRADVDPDRIAIWGSSFGGGHVLKVGSDTGIAAVVAQCPFTDGTSSLRALGLRSTARMLPAMLHDAVAPLIGRPARRVALIGEPGSGALMTAPDALPGYRALIEMIPDGTSYEETVDGRIGLAVPLLAPGRNARNITAPLLVCVCDHDTVAPAGPTLRYASRAPHGEVKRYPVGHFDIYTGEAFEQVVADQVDFLVRHLNP